MAAGGEEARKTPIAVRDYGDYLVKPSNTKEISLMWCGYGDYVFVAAKCYIQGVHIVKNEATLQ